MFIAPGECTHDHVLKIALTAIGASFDQQSFQVSARVFFSHKPDKNAAIPALLVARDKPERTSTPPSDHLNCSYFDSASINQMISSAEPAPQCATLNTIALQLATTPGLLFYIVAKQQRGNTPASLPAPSSTLLPTRMPPSLAK